MARNDGLHMTTIALKDGAVIVKDGAAAQNCGCCSCTTKWSEASAIEVELQMTSTFRQTVAVEYPIANAFGQQVGTSHDYATLQSCPNVYTGVFSLTKTGQEVADSYGGRTWYRTFWAYNFGNGTSLSVTATDDRDFNNATWDHLSVGISVASPLSWKRFLAEQPDPYPSAFTMCSGVAGDCIFQAFPFDDYCNVMAQVAFGTYAANWPYPVFLDRVLYYCSQNMYFAKARGWHSGQYHYSPFDENTSFDVMSPTLMSDLENGSGYGNCDRFYLTGSCVSLQAQSPAGVKGIVQLGSMQIKSVSVFF